MAPVHILVIALPSLAVGFLFGQSLLSGALWGLVAEAIGLVMRAVPTFGLGVPHPAPGFVEIVISLLLGAVAGALGFAGAKIMRTRKSD